MARLSEQDIERLARGLGEEAAGRLDVERVATRVVARLRAPAPANRTVFWAFWHPPLLVRLAAALAVIVGGALTVRAAFQRGSPEPAVPGAVASVPLLTDLSAEELVEAFDSLAVDAPVYPGVAVGLQALNETELRELLRRLEG
jgi:hypothetical protein